MARKRNQIAEDEITRIKKQVLQKMEGRIKNPTDCKYLARKILTNTGHYISESTLKRFLGFHHSNFAPSYETIKILNDFIDHKEQPRSEQAILYDLIVDFFNPIHFDTIDINDKSFQAACRRIAYILRSNQALFEHTMDGLAKNQLGRRFYYELFPDYEILSSFQFRGYEKYLEEEKSYEGQLFGNAILFLKSYFEKDMAAMKERWKTIVKLFNPQKKCHHFVLGRYYQTCLIGSYYFNKTETASIIQKAYKIGEKTKQNNQVVFREFPGFHYFVCDGLWSIKAYDHLHQFSHHALHDFDRTEEFIWKGYYDQLYLYHALALVKLGKPTEAKKLLKHIRPERFYFISEKYFKKLHEELLTLMSAND